MRLCTRDLLALAAIASGTTGCGSCRPSPDAEIRLRATPAGTVKLFRESIRNRWTEIAYRTLAASDRAEIDELDFVAASEDRRLRRALSLPLHRIQRTADGTEVVAGGARIPMVREGGQWRLRIAQFLEKP